MTKPNAAVKNVSPALAQKWITESNVRNRPLRERVVRALVRDMVAGRWQLTGEPIKFAADGTLLDGQHRLAAIVKSGCTITTFVVSDLATESQDVMDSGLKRSAADALGFDGMKNVNHVAAVARLALSINPKNRLVNDRITTAEVHEFVRENPSLPEAIHLLGRLIRGLPLAPRVAGYAFWRFYLVDFDAAVEFVETLDTLAGLDVDNPILALHRRLAGAYGANRKISTEEQLAAIMRAWNLWRKGQGARRIQTQGRTGEIPIPEPI